MNDSCPNQKLKTLNRWNLGSPGVQVYQFGTIVTDLETLAEPHNRIRFSVLKRPQLRAPELQLGLATSVLFGFENFCNAV